MGGRKAPELRCHLGPVASMDSLGSIEMGNSIGRRRRGDGQYASVANVGRGVRHVVSRYRRTKDGNNVDPLSSNNQIILKRCMPRFEFFSTEHTYHSGGYR